MGTGQQLFHVKEGEGETDSGPGQAPASPDPGRAAAAAYVAWNPLSLFLSLVAVVHRGVGRVGEWRSECVCVKQEVPKKVEAPSTPGSTRRPAPEPGGAGGEGTDTQKVGLKRHKSKPSHERLVLFLCRIGLHLHPVSGA